MPTRRLFSLAFVALLGLGLAACGGDDGDAGEDTTPSSAVVPNDSPGESDEAP